MSASLSPKAPIRVLVAEESEETATRIDSILRDAGYATRMLRSGSDKTKILTATIWLADMKDFPAMNTMWDPWVPQGATPARACVESKLATPAYKVEIRVVAAR